MWLAMVLAAVPLSDQWYRLRLAGTHAGWAHIVETMDGEIRRMTSTESLTIGRADVAVTVTARTTWTDTTAGAISMDWVQELGNEPVRTTWTFSGDEVVVSVEQGDRASSQTLPAPNTPWLTPMQARDLLAIRAEAGATTLTYHTMLPDLGLAAVRQVLTRIGAGSVDVDGRSLDVTKWRVQTEGLPVTMESWYSTDWIPVRTVMNAPFGQLESMLSTRSEAMSTSEGPPPELFASLFVKPLGDLGSQREPSRAFYRLRTRDGEPLVLPSCGAQTLAGVSDAGLLLMVERSGGLPPRVARGDVPVDPACLTRSAMIDAEDEAVVALAEAAVDRLPEDASDATRAEAARAHVHRWITRKGLTTAFASASETARDRQGDCSEHGVLLAAVLRSLGIPARVATGLVWIDGAKAFGWHMWTQAFIDGVWVDLDATLPVPFTVGHVLVATSPLQDGDGQRQLMALLGLLGNIEIEIVRVDP